MRRDVGRQRGAALLIVLSAMCLLGAVGGALVVLSITETAVGANYRLAVQLRYAADAGLAWALQDLRDAAAWAAALASVRSIDVGGALPSPVDLTAVTRELNRRTRGVPAGQPDLPLWRLYARGSLAALGIDRVQATALYVAVWIADDAADGDGDALSDTNGVVLLHVEAYGLSNARFAVDATVARRTTATGQSAVRLRSWRWHPDVLLD